MCLGDQNRQSKARNCPLLSGIGSVRVRGLADIGCAAVQAGVGIFKDGQGIIRITSNGPPSNIPRRTANSGAFFIVFASG